MEITVRSFRTELFPPLEEPYFWHTYFRRWVEEGLEEKSKIDKFLEGGEKPPSQ